MSRINKGLYSSEAHDWQTPPDFIQALLGFLECEQFRIDPCCSSMNIPARFHFIDGHTDGLKMKWSGSVFMNPPYGKVLKDWLKKCVEESKHGKATIWALVPSRTETVYQHDYGIASANFTVFLKGRLSFLKNGEPQGTAPFPTMLLYWGNDWAEVAARWLDKKPWPGTLMVRGDAE